MSRIVNTLADIPISKGGYALNELIHHMSIQRDPFPRSGLTMRLITDHIANGGSVMVCDMEIGLDIEKYEKILCPNQ